VVLASGLPIHNPGLENLTRDERRTLLGRAADKLRLSWWDRVSTFTAEVVTRHGRLEDWLSRSRLGDIQTTSEEIGRAETAVRQLRALSRILSAVSLAAGRGDAGWLDEFSDAAGIYLRKFDGVVGRGTDSNTAPEYFHGGDVPDPTRRGAVAEAAYELACEAALSLAYSAEPGTLAASAVQTLTSAPRRRAVTYAALTAKLPPDFNSPTRVEKATRAIRRLLDSQEPTADPWEVAVNVVRTYLRSVGYPKGEEKHLFDNVELDRATLEDWLALYTRPARS